MIVRSVRMLFSTQGAALALAIACAAGVTVAARAQAAPSQTAASQTAASQAARSQAASSPAAPARAVSQAAAPAAPAQSAQQPPQTPPAPAAPPAQPAAPAPAPVGSAAQQPIFKSGIDVVSLNVTVTDGAVGRGFITDLTRDDFLVFEDGVKQDVSFFSRTDTPISLSVLIDTSASMEEKMTFAQDAAIGFINRLRPEDNAQIIDFDSRVSILQNFTTDKTTLQSAIRKTSANGSTSLYNAVYIALKELKKIQPSTPDTVMRQAIVVLSDGEDTSSLVPFEEVLELAKRSNVAIYTIGLRGKEATFGRGFNEADFVLRQLAQETGGRPFFPQSITELAAIYGQINEELESQYLLAYTSRNPKRDGAYRRIVVRTTRPNAVARTKQGYYGPTS